MHTVINRVDRLGSMIDSSAPPPLMMTLDSLESETESKMSVFPMEFVTRRALAGYVLLDWNVNSVIVLFFP